MSPFEYTHISHLIRIYCESFLGELCEHLFADCELVRNGRRGVCHLKSVRELLEESFLNHCVEKLFTEHGIGFLSDAAVLHKEWSRSVHLVSLNTKEEDDPVLWSFCYRYKQFNELICYRFFWRLPNFPIFSQSAGDAMQASGHLHVTKLKLIH